METLATETKKSKLLQRRYKRRLTAAKGITGCKQSTSSVLLRDDL